MNQKTYMIPEVEILEIKMQGMIAESDPKFGGPGSGSSDAPIREEFEEFESLLDGLDFSKF